MTDAALPAGPFPASTLHGRTVPERSWNVADLIPAATVTLLAGDGGTGKSTLALQLAIAAATDSIWLGRNVKAGPVVYFSAEDDLDELHRRCAAICRGLGLGLDALADLHLWPLADCDALLAVEKERQLAATARWTQLQAAVDAVAPVLIVLDSLADLFGGNENDRGQARQFVGMLRQLGIKSGAAVLVISHPSLEGLRSKSGSSGSTAWSNSVRSRLYLSRPEGDDAGDPDVRILSLKKSNYAGTQPDMHLRRLSGGFQIDANTSLLPTNQAAAQAAIGETFLMLLDHYTVEGRTVSNEPGKNYAPALFAKDPRRENVTKAGFAAAMNRLFAAKQIMVDEYGPASRRRKRLVRMT